MCTDLHFLFQGHANLTEQSQVDALNGPELTVWLAHYGIQKRPLNVEARKVLLRATIGSG